MPDRAPIIAPPPLLGLLCIALGFVARHFAPLTLFPGTGFIQLLIGSALVVAGVSIILLARQAFISHGTHPNPYRPTAALVTTGLYRLSRNPIYVAFLLIVLAFVFFENSAWFFASAVALWCLLRFGVVNREERYLGDKFGEVYHDYCERVRRWI